jgi:hypothetical protein
MVLRRVFRTKREEVTERWRKLHYHGLHNLYSSANIIMMINGMMIRLTGHTARMGDVHTALKSKILKGKCNFRYPGVCGSIILELI